jgi:hypothetical protein
VPIDRLYNDMGKKTRRQKSLYAQGEILPLYRRFPCAVHKDGSDLSDEEMRQISNVAMNVRYVVDLKFQKMGISNWVGNITHDWLHEYTCAVAFPRIRTKGLDSALRALKRWPRLQPYWRRLRRRVCDHCASQVALSEPRYLVCGGCGVARYCSEECQCADWDSHQHICASMARRRELMEMQRAAGLH